MELELRLWGPLVVVDDGAPVELPPSRKARALLGYLVATARPHGRSALCDLLWSGVDDPRAGLRWALSRLRPVVDRGGHRRIVTLGDRVEFDASGADVDLHTVRSAVAGDPAEVALEALEEAARTFRGELLEDLDVPGCHQYEAWRMGMRERARRLQLSVLTALTDRLRGHPEAALPHAFTRLRLDPLSEEAHIAAMDVLGELGRLEQGLELYERCRRTLAGKLGTSPSPALEAARRRLRRLAGVALRADGPGEGPEVGERHDRLEGHRRTVAAALARLPAPEGLPEPGPDDHPLVGRAEELAALARAAGAAALPEAGRADGRDPNGGPAVTFITGEPGIGKTRLLRELVGRVRERGGWVLGARVFEGEEIRPYGPWIDLIRSLPVEALDRELARSLAGRADPGPGSRDRAPTERTQLFESVSRLLGRLAEARAPGLVALDDVQWLDPSSAALLHYLARTLTGSPVTFALAAREEEIDEGSAPARVLRSLSEGGRLRRIPLRRLDAAETATLVWAVDEAADPGRIFATSEGNPLFTLAMAASLGERGEGAPKSIDEELGGRLERLDTDARSLLPWVAALGRAFDLTILVRVVDRPAPEILQAIDRLERRGILRPTGPDRYDFTHSLLRRAAYRRLSEPARRAIHRSIARALDGSDGRDGERDPGMASAVAHHAEHGGLPELAARAYAEAGEHSLWLLAFDEAAELVARGVAQLEALPDPVRIPLEMALLRIYSFRSMRDRRPEDVEARVRRVTAAARDEGLTAVVAMGHAALVELQYQRGALEQAARSSLSAAEAGRAGEPVAAIRALTETATCLLLLDQAPEDARRLASEAFTLAEQHGVEMDVLALARAFLHHHDGELEGASRAFREVIRLGRRARDRWWECPALTRMTMVELDRGNPEAALDRAREAAELAERLGDETEAAFARGLQAVAEASRAAVDEALRELRLLDSLWAIGQLQAYAAEAELERGHTDAARERAEEAAGAARTLAQPSLLALAGSLLARSAMLEGAVETAEAHLDSAERTRPRRHLSHRARRALRQAHEAARR